MTSNGQSPVLPPASVTDAVNSKYGVEYVVTIDGKQYRAILPDHIRAIETANSDLDHARQLLAVQADEIASLKAQVQLETRLDAMNAAIQRLQADQVARLLAVTGKQDSLIDEMHKVEGGMPKKSRLDSFPIRFAFSALGGAANVRELMRPNPWSPAKGSPCNP